jgi:chaperonin GroES
MAFEAAGDLSDASPQAGRERAGPERVDSDDQEDDCTANRDPYAPHHSAILSGSYDQGYMRHQLRPLFDRVVIKELDPDRVRRSGLLVPPGSDEPPPQHGIVLAVGPGLDWWDHVGVQMPVKPGDHVVFPASAGAWVEVDEERLLVCRVGELLGVLEQAAELLAT